uniref:Uncharacterized protein n=1 Tax=Leersia perrieri TaxID=77586 RepID=A0A0D9UZM8_9ORYZ
MSHLGGGVRGIEEERDGAAEELDGGVVPTSRSNRGHGCAVPISAALAPPPPPPPGCPREKDGGERGFRRRGRVACH